MTLVEMWAIRPERRAWLGAIDDRHKAEEALCTAVLNAASGPETLSNDLREQLRTTISDVVATRRAEAIAYEQYEAKLAEIRAVLRGQLQ
jgi:hypothetical protein